MERGTAELSGKTSEKASLKKSSSRWTVLHVWSENSIAQR